MQQGADNANLHPWGRSDAYALHPARSRDPGPSRLRRAQSRRPARVRRHRHDPRHHRRHHHHRPDPRGRGALDGALRPLADHSRRRAPSRRRRTFAKENANVAWQYADWIRAGELGSVDDIRDGDGAVVRRGARFDALGHVISGPANRDLALADDTVHPPGRPRPDRHPPPR